MEKAGCDEYEVTSDMSRISGDKRDRGWSTLKLTTCMPVSRLNNYIMGIIDIY